MWIDLGRAATLCFLLPESENMSGTPWALQLALGLWSLGWGSGRLLSIFSTVPYLGPWLRKRVSQHWAWSPCHPTLA